MNQKLTEIKPIPGKHCESSAMLNALIGMGYEISEDQIIGAGAAPGFVYERSQFPFLGGRSHQMRGCFIQTTGIPFRITEKALKSSWKDIEKLISEGVPVVLRVDMRYLPYRYNGKFGPRYMSFGWHYITLFHIDTQRQIAKVSDTEHNTFQSIKIADLAKARFSKTKNYPPEGEYYYFLPAEPSFTPDWQEIARVSLIQYAKNMTQESANPKQLVGLDGLKQLSSEILNLPKRIPTFLVSAVLDFHHGCIETNGTGGAAFRLMYFRFIRDHYSGSNRDTILALLDNCVQAWHSLGESYKQGAQLYGSAKSKTGSPQKNEILSSISKQAQQVHLGELELYQAVVGQGGTDGEG